MNAPRRRQSGFTLVEMMISATLMVIVFISIFSVIVASQRIHNTENRRLDMNQSARGIDQFMIEPCRDAGAVLGMLNTVSFLGALPEFNGVLPLYNPVDPTAYPDGILVAAGDPAAVTFLADDFSDGDDAITVLTTNVQPVNITPVRAWHAGDFGMIARAGSYYVFRVTEEVASDTELSVATTAAYRSNLLATTNYDDPCSHNGDPYPSGLPVIRLDHFAVFLVRSESDGSRTLVMVNDFNGANLAADLSTAPAYIASGSRMTGPVPILTNLQDLQISYVLNDGTVLPSGAAAKDALLNKTVAALRFEVLLRTEEETDKQGAGIVYRQPPMGDSAASGQLLTGRYRYQYFSREIGLRNFII